MQSDKGDVRKPSGRRLALWLTVVPAMVAGLLGVAYLVTGGRTLAPRPKPADVAQQSDAESNDAPKEDSWKTEEFAEAASGQLSLLADAVKASLKQTSIDLGGLISSSFSCSRLRPEAMETKFDSPAISVSQWRREETPPALDGSLETLGEELAVLAAPFRDATEIHVKFKIYGVQAEDELITTKVIYQASGRFDDRSIQQSAEWTCRWRQAVAEQAPLLDQISLEEFEEVTGRAPTGTLFADCTESVFRNEDSFARQILPGIDYWRGGIQAQHGVYPYGHHGVAVGDANGDGLDDIYACQPAGLPNRLYLQNRDGTVTDASKASGVDWLDRSRGALLIDIDNDDDQDLAVVVNNMILIMENDGTGKFSEQTSVRPTGDAGALVAADYDLDGDLDIFVVSYGQRFLSDGESSGPIPYHDANNGGPNMLLRNDGSWTFTDVTKTSGLDVNNRRWSFAASWEDYDGDGDADLYVANDFGRNNLYRNDEGTFVDAAAEAGVEDIAAGMSASWGDYDQDGKIDLYVGNMFSSAGLRISDQARFHADAPSQTRAAFRRHARGNSLFRNAGNGTFQDVSEEAGVTLGRWAWGSNFVDINNDGLEDLVVVNGFVTGSDTDDL